MFSRYAVVAVVGLATLAGVKSEASNTLNKTDFAQALNAEIPNHITTLRHGDWVEMDFEVFEPKSILILRMWYGDTPTLGQVMCDGDDIINAIKALLEKKGIDPCRNGVALPQI